MGFPPSDVGGAQASVMLSPVTSVASGVPGASGAAVGNKKSHACRNCIFLLSEMLNENSFSNISLTVLHLRNDGAGFQRSANSKLVDGRDPELVLIGLDELGRIESTLFIFITH